MKAVTVPTVDVSPGVEIKECFRKSLGYKRTLEDGNEDYIKLNMGIKE